jgi:DNA (cytosine-5)-methyltransferase 1
VRTIDWHQMIGEPIDLVAGGPPCQPFSIGGKHRGHIDGRDMWPEAIRAVRELQPRAFLFENVRGLGRPAFRHYLTWITRHLALPDVVRRRDESHVEHGERLRPLLTQAEYDVAVFHVNAADFGAPQKRHRVVIAGVRRGAGMTTLQPRQTHSYDRLLWDQWVSGDYWLRHGIKRPGRDPRDKRAAAIVAGLRLSMLAPETLPWVTVRDALSGLGEPRLRASASNHVFQPGARVYVGHTGSPLDEPAKALKAGDHGVPGGENMMVLPNGGVRYFTIREAARLQGLPDDYVFPCSWTESMRQLGNAVPVPLAHAFGAALARLLSRKSGVRQRAA